MFRSYLMPWLLGYSVMRMLSFPLESEVARGINLDGVDKRYAIQLAHIF